MEDKLSELLSKIYSEMQKGFKKIDKIEQDIEDLKQDVGGLKQDVGILKEGQKEIKVLISELDPKNANRHVQLNEKIDELRKDLNAVEIVTSKNWNDIAQLKAVK